MFEESLVESTGRLRTRDRRPALAAFLLQVAMAAAVISVPMLRPDVVPLATLPSTLFAPLAPKPPAPPPTRVHVEAHTASTLAPSVPTSSAAATVAPSLHPRSIPEPGEALVTSVDMAGSSSIPAAITSSGTSNSPAVVPAPKPGPTGPFKLSTGVSAGLLLAPIRPLYPEIARLTHAQGTVVVHAIISKSGHIESATVVSGPTMLQTAALDAVRSARYRPFLLNGLPTEVETTFNINFRLSE